MLGVRVGRGVCLNDNSSWFIMHIERRIVSLAISWINLSRESFYIKNESSSTCQQIRQRIYSVYSGPTAVCVCVPHERKNVFYLTVASFFFRCGYFIRLCGCVLCLPITRYIFYVFHIRCVPFVNPPPSLVVSSWIAVGTIFVHIEKFLCAICSVSINYYNNSSYHQIT